MLSAWAGFNHHEHYFIMRKNILKKKPNSNKSHHSTPVNRNSGLDALLNFGSMWAIIQGAYLFHKNVGTCEKGILHVYLQRVVPSLQGQLSKTIPLACGNNRHSDHRQPLPFRYIASTYKTLPLQAMVTLLHFLSGERNGNFLL